MKTQISRWSDEPAARRSGIYQQQGRMISDADLNELMELLKRRIDDALGEVVGSGTPMRARTDAVLPPEKLPAEGLVAAGTVATGLQLRRGALYVDGIRALLEPDPTKVTDTEAPFPLDKQADFPLALLAPTSTGNRAIYADVWDWSTTALQDEILLDPGLRGADTCTRTQTLVQVKWCAAPGATPAPECLDQDKNPAKGDAVLLLEIRQGGSVQDPCDPCAAELALDTRVGNYLFRLEVHDVKLTDNAPSEITLKWSSENAAEQHARADVPAEFHSGDWIYEFYNDTTEKHLGVHLSGFVPARGLLKDGWPTSWPTEDADHVAAVYDYVRRWDGYAVLVRSGTTGPWSIKSISSALQAKDKGRGLQSQATPSTHGDYKLGSDFVVYLSGLVLTLALNSKKFVAGDYWLAAVREDAAEAKRVQQVGEYEIGTGTNPPRHYRPLGITHHYLVLARLSGTNIQRDDAETRKLSFPRLTDFPADHVGYDPAPKGPRWDDITDITGTVQQQVAARPVNVQSAIDALLDGLESSDIRYELPACPGNTLRALLWSGATTAPHEIKELLNRLLCAIDSSTLPYAAGAGSGSTVKGVLDEINGDLPKKVNKAGDTMTGALVIEPSPPLSPATTPSLDVRGILATQTFRLTAPTGTPTNAVLALANPATGLATWLTTSLTAWNLSTSGNLSTDPASVTGTITLGSPASKALVNKDGKIGVGTDDPQTSLHIVTATGAEAAGYGMKWAWGQHIADAATQMWGLTGAYGRLFTWDSDSLFVGLKNEGANRKDAVIAWGDDAQDSLRFLFTPSGNPAPAPLELMRIASDGKIGVGTTAPLYRLHAVAPGGFGSENASGVSLAGDVPIVAQSDSTAIGVMNAQGRPAFALNIDGNGGTAATRGVPTFYDRYDGNWRAGISLKNGNVGIGNTNPQVRLDVAGQINASAAVFFNRLLVSASASNTVINNASTWVTLATPGATVSIPHATPLRIKLNLTRVDLSGTFPTVSFRALVGTEILPLGTLSTGGGGGTLNNQSLSAEIDFPAGATTVTLQWQVAGAFGASATSFFARTLRIEIM
ncbi:MAG: DUF6519 domain-containing protein [Pseudomonadota bacterium]